jgi:hypothetical protein
MTAAEDPLNQLSELPLEKFELIGPLERSNHGPFLAIKPLRVEALRPSISLPDEKKKVSRMTRRHFAWAIYPVVVCHDPGVLVDGLQIADPTPGESGLGRPDDELRELAGRVEHYRLSALAGRTFPRPLWCTVMYGPWYGRFIEQESCTEGDNEHKWDFYLEGVQAPDLGVTTWFGGITDMPTVPSLSVIWGTLQSELPKYAPCGEVGFPETPEQPA